MVGHRQMGAALSYTGEIARGRAHFDQAFILYDPAEHRSLVTRFGQDVRVASLFQRSLSLWLLGHPDAALMDASDALSDARETGHAASLTYALLFTWFTQIFCGNYSAAAAQADEIVTMADEKGSVLWNACGVVVQGCVAALTGRASDAVQIITSGIGALRVNRIDTVDPVWLSFLAKAHAELGQIGDAQRCLDEAMAMTETTGEIWYEAELYRMAGEMALRRPNRMRPRRKLISSAASRLRASSKQSPGNFARR